MGIIWADKVRDDCLGKKCQQSLSLLDVFMLVFVRNGDVPSVFLQVHSHKLSKSLIVCGKGQIQNSLDRILPNTITVNHQNLPSTLLQGPIQTSKQIRIDAFHILKGDRLAQNHLVKGRHKEGIQEPLVKDGQPDDTAYEFKVPQVLWVHVGMGVDLKRVIIMGRVFKEAVEGVEHFMGKQKEKLSKSVSYYG